MKARSQPPTKLSPVKLGRIAEVLFFLPLFVFLAFISYFLFPYSTAGIYLLFPVITIAFIFFILKGITLHAYSRILLVAVGIFDLSVLMALIYIVFGLIRDTQGQVCTYTFFTSSVVSCVEYHSITLFWMTALYAFIPTGFLMAIATLAQFFVVKKYSDTQNK